MLKDYVELTGTPLSDSIKVYIDNKATSMWSYDRNDNLIILEMIPDHGSHVVVTYLIESS